VGYLKPSQKDRLNAYKDYEYPKDAYIFFHNRKVKIYLNNGNTLIGYIIKEYKYEVILIKSEGIKDKNGDFLERRNLIPKHSICYIEDYFKL
jgi:sRNA-binding regulator protein Hfq